MLTRIRKFSSESKNSQIKEEIEECTNFIEADKVGIQVQRKFYCWQMFTGHRRIWMALTGYFRCVCPAQGLQENPRRQRIEGKNGMLCQRNCLSTNLTEI